MNDEFTLTIDNDQIGTPAYRTKGMYRIVVPDEEATATSGFRQFREVWVDGGRYTGEKLRQIRKDGKHR